MFASVIDFAVNSWQMIADTGNNFVQQRTIGGKFAYAHNIALPILLVIVVLFWWLDKYDSTSEKIIYIIYLVLGVEVLIFLALFLTILGQ